MKCKDLLMIAIVLFVATSCASGRKVLYLQDAKPGEMMRINQNYEIRVNKDDLLSIMVTSEDPELALPFNMPVVSYQLGSSGSGMGQQRILGYLVDADGTIDFPVLGKLFVEGMTRDQLTTMLKRRLVEDGHIAEPVVTVQFLNFKISVIGEVSRAGNFNITDGRITLLEALSLAGDLTIYGRRDRVAVIREKEGERTIVYHDLRSAEIFNSPYFYLQQNDVIYVEPNKARSGQTYINQNNSIGVWLSIISSIASMAVLIINL